MEQKMQGAGSAAGTAGPPPATDGARLMILWGPRSGLCEPRGSLETLEDSTGVKDSDSALLALGFRQVRTPWQVNRGNLCLSKIRTHMGMSGESRTLRGPLLSPTAHLVQHWLVQLLLLDAQVADPGQELLGLDEEAGAQQEGEDVGFLGGHSRKAAHIHKCQEDVPAREDVPASPSTLRPSQPQLCRLPLAWWNRAHFATPPPYRVDHPPQGSSRRWAPGAGSGCPGRLRTELHPGGAAQPARHPWARWGVGRGCPG